MRVSLCLGLVLSLLAACADDELTAEHRRWDGQHITSYHFTWQHAPCWCGTDDLRVKRVAVVDGAVASAVYVDTSQPVDLANDRVRTIDGIFDWLEAWRAKGALELDVKYDPALGYPTSFFIDPSQATDDEDTYFFTDLVKDP
jgi:hypothetical protein